MYCRFCGKEIINENQAICLNCGCAVESVPVDTRNKSISVDDYYRKLSEYEKMSGVVWLVIGIIQICTLIGIICGIWNIIVSISRLKYANELLNKPTGITEKYENQLTEIIIIMVLNIFLGAIIGVVGSVIDLFVRNYVIENKNIFK